MQDLWQHKLDWDDIIPPTIYTAWTEFTTQLNSINELIIERWVMFPSFTDVQIYGFCDASIKGYDACLYTRSTNKHNNAVIYAVIMPSSMCQIASLKIITIPRLELCGALLLIKLYREVRDVIELLNR